MVSGQTDVVADERGDALVFDTRDGFAFAFPKITVVYQQQMCAPIGGGLNHLAAGCDSGGDSRYTVTALYLQAIWGVVFVSAGVEQRVDFI